MQTLQILILALVQGLTEFLPISSSGHLILVPALTGWGDQGLIVDVAVHMGTLMAVLLYFWRDTLGLGSAFFGMFGIGWAREIAVKKGYHKLFWALVIATLPILFVGFFIKTLGVDQSLRSPILIATTSIVFGILLYFVDRQYPHINHLEKMNIKPALLIGVSQILALMPGTSRSGITITAARFLGFTRREAARFSMLLSIPTILGAGVLTFVNIPQDYSDQALGDAALAMGLAFLAALVSIHFLMRWLRHASLAIFAVYRVVLGLILFGLIFGGNL